MITSTLRLSELKLAIIHEPLEVPADATVMQAIALMSNARSQYDAASYSDNQQQQLQQEARSSCVLVLENQQVIGILSERDVVRLTAQQQPMAHLVIREVMHTPIFMVKLDELLSNVQELIYGHSLREVVVVGDRGELIGIVTQTSLLQALNSLAMSNSSVRVGSEVVIARQQADLEETNDLLVMTNEELKCTIEELRVSTEELIMQHRKNEYERFRYQNLFDFAPDGYLVTDSSGRILEANQAILKMLAISHEYILGKPFIVFILPDHRHLFDNQLKYLLSPDHIKISEEMTLITRHGKNFPAEITITQNINLLDRSIQLLWMVRDISDRKQAEQALQLANQSLELKVRERTQELWKVNKLQRAILDSTDYAIISTDLNGIIQTFNAGAEKMFGYSMGEVIGKITPEIFFDHQELIDRAASTSQDLAQNDLGFVALMAMANQEVLSQEWTNIRKDGSRFPVELSVTSLKDDDERTIGFLSVRKDLSDRKQAEKALKESERLFSTLVSTSPVAITRFDLCPLNCIYVSERWSEMTGRSTASAMGRGWLDAVHPDERDMIIGLTEHEFFSPLSRQFILTGEGRHLRPDGTINWYFSQLVKEFNDSGEVTGYIGTLTDISDRKQSETKLQLANEELKRATRLKDDFLANMSHELRTPLNSILGMNEALQEGIFGSINEHQLKALQTIESSSTHLLTLINDILDVAKIESGQVTLELTATNLDSLCKSSLAFIKQQALTKRIQLISRIPKYLPEIMLDERRIRQVLINLLNNAVKFTLDGGTITLEVSQVQLESSTTNLTPLNYIKIAVIDTGIGISAENIQKLFQPFIQIDSALNRKHDGTGLGLALVKRLVELHGGTVELTSEVGVGSCFAINLPINVGSPVIDAQSENLSGQSQIGQSQTEELISPLILLAEDSEANIATFSTYLEAKGYRFLFATDGQKAIDLAKAAQPDLILMDIQMPVMDGLEAIKQIRLDPNLVNIPIIALTTLAMTGDRESCLEAGANEYLTKPIKLKQLAATIQKLL